MTAPAAITAQLVDVRNVSAHRCVRLELHVPAEQAGLVMAAFGWPTMADPVPVALARLNDPYEPIAKPEAQKERTAFTDKPYATQAGMRCNEGDFTRFLIEKHRGAWEGAVAQLPTFVLPPETSAEALRLLCNVSSRSKIIKGTPAGDKWEALEAEYYAWSRGMR